MVEKKEPADLPDGMVLTLWGEAVYSTAGKKGRPPFQWTAENAAKINMLLSIGWRNEAIAEVILDPRTGKPISIATLKRHFRTELAGRSGARHRRQARQLELAYREAERGNVGAMRLFAALCEKNEVMTAADAMRMAQQAGQDDGEEKPASAYVAKRDVKRREAESAAKGDGSEFGDLLTPGAYRN